MQVHLLLGGICSSLHLVHEGLGRVLDVAHGFAELAGQLGQLFGPEQEQSEHEHDGGIGWAKHGLAGYFPADLRVIFFLSTKI